MVAGEKEETGVGVGAKGEGKLMVGLSKANARITRPTDDRSVYALAESPLETME